MTFRGAGSAAPASPPCQTPFATARFSLALSVLGRSRAALAGAVVASLLGARIAHAGLVDEPFVGGVGFASPTNGDPAAVYWNPAALGTTQDLSVQVSGSARLDRITVDRRPISSGTGLPTTPDDPGATTFPRATSRTLTQPLDWPPGPGSFVGVFKDLGDRFTLAFATYRPYEEHIDYGGAGSSPTRFHRVRSDLGSTALTPAVGIRLSQSLRVGLSLTNLLSTGRLVVDEPGPTGLENDPGSIRLDLDGSNVSYAWLIGGGAYFRRRTWSAGMAFATRPLGNSGGGIALTAGRSRLTRSDGSTINCPDGVTPGCTYADITYKLPFIWTSGVSFFPSPGLELSAFERVQLYPGDDRIDIRVTSPSVGSGTTQALPRHVVLARGATRAFDTRVRAAYWLREWCRVGLGARFETGAVPTELVNPGAVDGPKLGPFGAVQMRTFRHVWLQAGYAFTYQLPLTVASSAFSPEATEACAAASGDLTDPACQTRLAGLARPTSAGTYRRFTQDFTLGVLLSF